MRINDQIRNMGSSAGIIRLPETVLYDAPLRHIDGKLNRDLHEALALIGAPPVDASGRFILSGMQQYDLRVITNPDYPYPGMDYKIYEENAARISSFINQAIVIELGPGGAVGARKTGTVIGRVPEEQQPAGVILVDWLEDNLKPAKDSIASFDYPKDKIYTVPGDMSVKKTQDAINKKIKIINENTQSENGRHIFCVIHSPTFNGLSDEDGDNLQDNIFGNAQKNISGLNSPNIVFCIAIDNTLDINFLRKAYDNPFTRQFALTAVAHWCWSHGKPFDPLKASSVVEITRDADGCISIRHVVEERQRYEIQPIRKIPRDVLIEKFKNVQTHILQPAMSCQLEGFPGVDYAVYPLMRLRAPWASSSLPSRSWQPRRWQPR